MQINECKWHPYFSYCHLYSFMCNFILYLFKYIILTAINVQSDHGPLCDTYYSVDTSAVGTYLQPTKSTRLHNYISPLL